MCPAERWRERVHLHTLSPSISPSLPHSRLSLDEATPATTSSPPCPVLVISPAKSMNITYRTPFGLTRKLPPTKPFKGQLPPWFKTAGTPLYCPSSGLVLRYDPSSRETVVVIGKAAGVKGKCSRLTESELSPKLLYMYRLHVGCYDVEAAAKITGDHDVPELDGLVDASNTSQ